MKGICITFLFCFFLSFLFAQKGTIKISKPLSSKSVASTDSSKRREFSIDPFPVLGYLWQGYGAFEIGVKAMHFFQTKKHSHENISLILGGDIFKHYKTTVSPFSTLKYYHQYKKSGMALNVSCNYWLTKMEGITDQRITPEIGIALGIISVS